MADYEKLIKAGVDMDSLLQRLMGNASLARVFIKKFTEDKTFEKLQAAFEQQDLHQAEMASHTLKGMCGNLSLTELYGAFSEQTNLLRSGDHRKAEAMMDSLTVKYRHSLEMMQAWLSES